MAIVSYDKVEVLDRFARRNGSRLTLLADPGSRMIRAFGVLNDRFPPGSPGHGVAHPIIFAIDAKGVVSHRFSKENYEIRPEIEIVLQTLRQQ